MAARHRQHGKKKAEEEKHAKVDCGECGKPAGLVNGDAIYPHRPDLHHLPFWRCGTCHAYVSCHDGTFRPKGTPCGPETRKARIAAHAAFDPLWRRKAEREVIPYGQARDDGYKWLAGQLGIGLSDCHIGMMDTETARKVVEVCKPARAA